MALRFDASWRFDTSPGEIPNDVFQQFSGLIGRIASQGDAKEIFEHFKDRFAAAAGTSGSYSSNTGWAESDLHSYMQQASSNPAMFIEAFFEGCESLRSLGVGVPGVSQINRILAEANVPYRIEPPNLLWLSAPDFGPKSEVPIHSLDREALEVLQKSLSVSEQLLAEGRGRLAVQELLWLLETVSTAFKGVDTGAGTVQGKYFNKIVSDLRHQKPSATLKQILEGMMALHGYLSSPSGGGVRHGADLTDGAPDMSVNEARLFCNLIRSYITFLITEHARLVGKTVLD